MKSKIFLLVFVILSSLAFADNVDMIEKANKDYTTKKYEEAIGLYKQVFKSNNESWQLYFNLGNACYKNNDIPSAILNYEKALKLNPGNEDISYNLKVANTRITDKIETIPILFYKRWWEKFYNLFSADGWGKLTITLFFLFFVLLTIYLLSKNIIIRKLGFWAGVGILCISIFTFILGFEQYKTLKYETHAIVFSPTLTVKGGPDEGNSDLFVIHEGIKVRIIDKVNNWYRIKIADGSDGWVQTDKVEVI